MNKPVSLRISRIVEEAEGVKTFYFRHHIEASPGQFLMVWLPGVDEKPVGVSYQDEASFAVTVRSVGPWSSRMHALEVGDILGIRGPYGSSFSLEGELIICVAGGYGAAPLAFLAEEAKKRGLEVDFVIGARDESKLLFRERLGSGGVNYLPATDDGSCGHHGFCTELLERRIQERSPDKVFAVGPEKMMKSVVTLCERYGIPVEVSLERYMKCGFGVCGQCCVDDSGFRMCKEGPVLDQEKLKKVKEFGEYRRDAAGNLVRF
ncbi:dihydroorotate dehydrogenase electron transfer subunit [Candidatus Woesearchaeota archaeon]|nr:dihydroorotate dehydrogenase electron transfer subunit [Candidatus Woesearchaeota archaeon]